MDKSARNPRKSVLDVTERVSVSSASILLHRSRELLRHLQCGMFERHVGRLHHDGELPNLIAGVHELHRPLRHPSERSGDVLLSSTTQALHEPADLPLQVGYAGLHAGAIQRTLRC